LDDDKPDAWIGHSDDAKIPPTYDDDDVPYKYVTDGTSTVNGSSGSIVWTQDPDSSIYPHKLKKTDKPGESLTFRSSEGVRTELVRRKHHLENNSYVMGWNDWEFKTPEGEWVEAKGTAHLTGEQLGLMYENIVAENSRLQEDNKTLRNTNAAISGGSAVSATVGAGFSYAGIAIGSGVSFLVSLTLDLVSEYIGIKMDKSDQNLAITIAPSIVSGLGIVVDKLKKPMAGKLLAGGAAGVSIYNYIEARKENQTSAHTYYSVATKNVVEKIQQGN